MTPDRIALRDRIEGFDIDGGDAAFPFAARLAREHGWSRPHAERVIREYKRYVFLAMSVEEPVCPSEDVDAAWHLHLTYTRSYWKRFCGDVLGRPLHHEPTLGGPAEAAKHLAMYEATLAAYRKTFGEEPPPDIWTPARDRFGIDLKHRDVNTAQNWVIPKLPVKRILQTTAAFLLVAAIAPGCAGGDMNPFKLKGEEFLVFLIPMMLGAVCVGRILRSTFRRPEPQPGDDALEWTWEQTAYLAGKYPRLTTAAIARLVEIGAAHVDEETKILHSARQHDPQALSAVERAVYNAMPFGNKPADMKPVVQAVEAAFANEAARLESEGFLTSSSQQAGISLASLLPLAVVILALAVPRLLVGLSENKPVGYLIATMIFGGVGCSIICLIGQLRLTRRGEDALVWLKTKHSGMKSGTSSNAGLAVALFGTAALAGTSIFFLQTWYPRQTDASGCGSGCGTSSGGDGGGGDGGGGGCGGCGGGGD